MALAFTSLGVTEDKLVNHQGGWVFHVQGELCHLIGSLRPNYGKLPSYAQLYLYDAQLALAHRMTRNNNLCTCTMETLQLMMVQFHPYMNHFLQVCDVLDRYPNNSDANIYLRVLPGQDRQQYNLLCLDEVAVILSGDGTAAEQRDIILHPWTDLHTLIQIDNRHPMYAPLHYVLLFPNGDHGWHRDLFHRPIPGSNPRQDWNPPHMTQTQYNAFHLHTQNNKYSSIH